MVNIFRIRWAPLLLLALVVIVVGGAVREWGSFFQRHGGLNGTSSAQALKTAILVQAGHTGVINAVAFSPDGKVLASASHDSIRLWDTSSGLLLRTLRTHGAEAHPSLECLPGICRVAFSPDGQTLAGSNDDTAIRLWDMGSGRLLQLFSGHTNVVYSVAFSPDGQILATGSHHQIVKLWDLATGKLLRTLYRSDGGVYSTVDIGREVLAVGFSPDGKRLASQSRGRIVYLWDVKSGKRLDATGLDPGKFHFDRCLAPSVRHSNIAAACGNGEILLSDKRDGKLLARLVALGANEWVIIAPDGRFDASSGGMNEIHFVVGLKPVPLSQFKARYYEPGLLTKILGHPGQSSDPSSR